VSQSRRRRPIEILISLLGLFIFSGLWSHPKRKIFLCKGRRYFNNFEILQIRFLNFFKFLIHFKFLKNYLKIIKNIPTLDTGDIFP
jgi:hypothetical protein